MFTVALSIVSCSAVIKNNNNANQLSQKPLVFIHGIKGGTLVDTKTNKVVWLNPFEGLGLSTPDLRLPLEWSDEEIPKQNKDNIIPIAPLNKVTLIPNIVDVKIYNGIYTEAPKKYKNFYPFGYDWRRNNLENVESYLKTIKKIVRKHNQPVKVVAHSMGGLITMAAMQKDPELFDSVFFVGVPFKGGIGFLEDLHLGVANGLNKNILSPEVMATMPSTYSLFPLDRTNKLIENNKAIDVDFFNPKDWENLKIGPFAYEFSNNEKFKKHFANALKVTKIFRQQIEEGKITHNGKKVGNQPKVYVVYGKSFPTLEQLIKNGPKSYLGWDFESATKIEGDGRVPAVNSYPPAGVEVTEDFESKAEHGGQLNDPQVLSWILSKE